jgi:hypothetical protein
LVAQLLCQGVTRPRLAHFLGEEPQLLLCALFAASVRVAFLLLALLLSGQFAVAFQRAVEAHRALRGQRTGRQGKGQGKQAAEGVAGPRGVGRRLRCGLLLLLHPGLLPPLLLHQPLLLQALPLFVVLPPLIRRFAAATAAGTCARRR